MKYPVQSNNGSFGVRACPFFKQYSQPSPGELASEDNFAFKWTALWELQAALKHCCVLVRITMWLWQDYKSQITIKIIYYRISIQTWLSTGKIFKNLFIEPTI